MTRLKPRNIFLAVLALGLLVAIYLFFSSSERDPRSEPVTPSDHSPPVPSLRDRDPGLAADSVPVCVTLRSTDQHKAPMSLLLLKDDPTWHFEAQDDKIQCTTSGLPATLHLPEGTFLETVVHLSSTSEDRVDLQIESVDPWGHRFCTSIVAARGECPEVRLQPLVRISVSLDHMGEVPTGELKSSISSAVANPVASGALTDPDSARITIVPTEGEALVPWDESAELRVTPDPDSEAKEQPVEEVPVAVLPDAIWLDPLMTWTKAEAGQPLQVHAHVRIGSSLSCEFRVIDAVDETPIEGARLLMYHPIEGRGLFLEASGESDKEGIIKARFGPADCPGFGFSIIEPRHDFAKFEWRRGDPTSIVVRLPRITRTLAFQVLGTPEQLASSSLKFTSVGVVFESSLVPSGVGATGMNEMTIPVSAEGFVELPWYSGLGAFSVCGTGEGLHFTPDKLTVRQEALQHPARPLATFSITPGIELTLAITIKYPEATLRGLPSLLVSPMHALLSRQPLVAVLRSTDPAQQTVAPKWWTRSKPDKEFLLNPKPFEQRYESERFALPAGAWTLSFLNPLDGLLIDIVTLDQTELITRNEFEHVCSTIGVKVIAGGRRSSTISSGVLASEALDWSRLGVAELPPADGRERPFVRASTEVVEATTSVARRKVWYGDSSRATPTGYGLHLCRIQSGFALVPGSWRRQRLHAYSADSGFTEAEWIDDHTLSLVEGPILAEITLRNWPEPETACLRLRPQSDVGRLVQPVSLKFDRSGMAYVRGVPPGAYNVNVESLRQEPGRAKGELDVTMTIGYKDVLVIPDDSYGHPVRLDLGK